MGRANRTFVFVGSGKYTTADTQFDALGRVWRVSNPYESTGAGSAINPSGNWTTNAYDALGRTVSVTTPDNAQVLTAYGASTSGTLGTTVTVTDQAGKPRKSVTDALGRLVQLYEAPTGLNYLTSYSYDALDNLTTVAQGTQNRYFMYDSLNRLIRARNPEQDTYSGLNLTDPLTGNSQWSMAYEYDSNGNLTVKTDARNVSSTYVYDALNRNTTVNYSDTTSINPDITRIYDGASNGKGRFWYSYSGGNYSAGATVEHTAIDSYDALGRPLTQRQLFKLNGVWGPTYQISRAPYDLAGGVTLQTYPSGRTVSYTYDDAGRAASFTGNLGDGVNRTYATGIKYSDWGGLSHEQFGTDIPLYHKQNYTNRGQLFDMRVSTLNDGSWNRGAIVNYYSLSNWGFGNTGTDTNGNLYGQQHWVPHNEQMSAYTVHQQNYDYDSLNRISWVGEYLNGGTPTGAQQYSYDRWGNRKIDPATWGTGINNKQFAVNEANNRLGVPGGQSGVMSYDNAGNLITDTYTADGSRTYDAENRMTSAQGTQGNWQYYAYNADGQRVRRKMNVVGTVETWQVYGMDGELLAEYAANGAASSPQKEYGYRNGQLLVTADAPAESAQNVTWTNASGVTVNGNSLTQNAGFGYYYGASATQTLSGDGYVEFTASAAVDGSDYRFVGLSHIATNYWQSIDFCWRLDPNGIANVCFGGYASGVQTGYVAGDKFRVAVEGGVIKFKKNGTTIHTAGAPTFPLYVDASLWEIGATVNNAVMGAGGSPAQIHWLVTDQLGTPRMIFDKTGSLANVKRHDYLPFGEELFAGTGGRTTQNGYTGDAIRQKFTNYERDNETGLDFAQARYHASVQGRFTSVDPLSASASVSNPQTFNRYTYALNSPQKHTDPTGMLPLDQAPGQFGPAGAATNNIDSGSGALTSGGIEEIMDIPFETAIKEHNAMVLQQASTRPNITEMVTPNQGVGMLTTGSYRFHENADGTIGHDGDHVLGDRNGSKIRAINGLTGTVLTWFSQGGGAYSIFIQISPTLVLVLKDVESPSSKIRQAQFTSPKHLAFLDKKGNALKPVTLKAGDLIGQTSRWSGSSNISHVGMHFGFAKIESIQQYRTNIAKGIASPRSYFVAPCGSSSPARC